MYPLYIAFASAEANAEGKLNAAVRVTRYENERSIGEDFGSFRVEDPTDVYKKHRNAEIVYQVRAPRNLLNGEAEAEIDGPLVAAFDLAQTINDFLSQAEGKQVSPAAFKTFMKKYIEQLEHAVTREDRRIGRRVLRGRGRVSFEKVAMAYNARKMAELESLERANITRELRQIHTENIIFETTPEDVRALQAAAQNASIFEFEQKQKGKAFSSGDGGAVYALLCAMDLLNDIFREARGDAAEFPYDKFPSIKPPEEEPIPPVEALKNRGFVFLMDAAPQRDFSYCVYEETVFERLGLPTTGPRGRALLKFIDKKMKALRDGEKNSGAGGLFQFRSTTEDTPKPPKLSKTGKRTYTPRRGPTLWKFWRISPVLFVEGARFEGHSATRYSHYGRSVYAAIIDKGFSNETAGQIARAAFYIDNIMWRQIDHIRALKQPAARELICPDGIARIKGYLTDIPLQSNRRDRQKRFDALKEALAQGAGIHVDIKKRANAWIFEASKVIRQITDGEPEIVP